MTALEIRSKYLISVASEARRVCDMNHQKFLGIKCTESNSECTVASEARRVCGMNHQKFLGIKCTESNSECTVAVLAALYLTVTQKLAFHFGRKVPLQG